MRLYAWVELVQILRSMRSDDLQGLLTSSITLLRHGIEAVLDRTKTLGPARKVRWIQVFISKCSYIADPTWMAAGIKILGLGGFSMKGDFLVGLPNEDWNTMLCHKAEYSDMCALTRKVLVELRGYPRYFRALMKHSGLETKREGLSPRKISKTGSSSEADVRCNEKYAPPCVIGR